MKIDSHQHYWQLTRFEYDWIHTDNPALNQDRMPPDLIPQMQAAGIECAVFVHATGTPDEIPWMLSLSDAYPYITGVVGSLNLAAPDAPARLDMYTRDDRFKGVRINVTSRRDHALSQIAGLPALAARGLSCDVLIGNDSLPVVCQMVAAHPEVVFVLDHLACQSITVNGALGFGLAIKSFAALTNAVMKLSGYLTASVRGGVPRSALHTTLSCYVDAALSVFGVDRLMFGSDWPVCTMAGSYAEAMAVLNDATNTLSTTEQSAIWDGTAKRVYRLA